MTDHTKVNQELMALAKSKNITVPTQADKQHQEAAAALAKLQGADFARDYIHHQLTDHDKAVQPFSKQGQEGHDTDIKAFASNTLPTMQKHLRLARDSHQ